MRLINVLFDVVFTVSPHEQHVWTGLDRPIGAIIKCLAAPVFTCCSMTKMAAVKKGRL